MAVHSTLVSDRRSFISGSDTPIIAADDESGPLAPWRERLGKTEPSDISGEPCATQCCDRAGATRSPSRVCAAHAEFVAALTGTLPRAIPVDVDAADLEDRSDHVNKVLNALLVYVTAILSDTAQNIPGRVDFGDISAALSDLASDLTGTIRLAAGAMAAGRIA